MRLDLVLRGLDAAAMTECARAADHRDGPTLWLPESPGDRSPFVTATALLSATTATRVGTGVIPIPLRAPIDLLTAALTIGEAFPGRFDLGAGSGNVKSLAAAGVAPSAPPLRVAGQFLDQVAALDTRTGLAAKIDIPAAVRRPPVYLAAHNRRMIDLAVSRADGVILNMVAASDLPRTMEYVASRGIAAGRAPFVVLFQLACFAEGAGTGGTAARGTAGDAAIAAARRVLSGFLRSPAVRRRLRSFGSRHAELADRLAATPPAGDGRALAEVIPDSAVADFAVLSASDLEDRIALADAHGVTALSLSVFPVPLRLRKPFPPVPEGNSALPATLAAIEMATRASAARGAAQPAGGR
jgi:alkanesulfonate monooxygenase SsuD/methylene tetrahydromethanopterin reductase-like flavin-dependent oxidoreductase (luciferase family)